jgi:hypothetical protein
MKRANQVTAGLDSESLLCSQREGILCKPFFKRPSPHATLYVQETHAGSTDAVKKVFAPLVISIRKRHMFVQPENSLSQHQKLAWLLGPELGGNRPLRSR